MGQRQLSLAAMAAVMVALALAGWRALQEPGWEFPVEELKLVAGQPQFSERGMIPEEQVSLAGTVWSRTHKPVTLVIVDSRAKASNAVYAFVGTGGGTVYTLRPAGLHAWGIVAKAKWRGDPRDFLRRIPAAPP